MVVDGQLLVRTGVARLLQDGDRLNVLSVSGGGPEVPSCCAAESIDVLVTDVKLPAVDAIELSTECVRNPLARQC